MIEWLFFLLPVAALSGWLVARAHYKENPISITSPLNSDYFKGLNYLLNEQPDKAIDVFIHLLEVNSETVETHLALANLFRRKGESERAIRIHQNLIARPTLDSTQRDQVLIELGLDYMHAGVLDRAEQLFLELLDKPSPPSQALEQLVRIYQQEKEWLKAIEMAKQLYPHRRNEMGPLIAQFYCELAEQQLDLTPAIITRHIKNAYQYDHNCVRSTLLEANIYIKEGDFRRALKCLDRIEQQDHHYLAEALPLMEICYQRINKLSTFETYLQAVLGRHPHSTSVRLMLASVIQQLHGSQAAQDFLHKQLQSYPSIEGLHALIGLGEQSNPILVPLIKGISYRLNARGHRYTCKQCGFSGKTLHWQCPGCKQWSTVKPTEIHLSAIETLLEPPS
jgi:lipopolysaccharide biosynthesis regulator YciM